MARFRDALPGTFGVPLALLILGAIAVASYVGLNHVAADARSVERTHRVVEGLDGVLAQVQAAESAQRGFLITGGAEFRQSYDAAVMVLPAQLQSIRRATIDNPRQQQLLTDLERLVAERLGSLQQGIDARRRGAGVSGTLVQRVTEGKLAMDGIRAAIAAMQAEEQRLLAVRSAGLAQDRLRTTLLVLVGYLVAFGLLFFAFRSMRTEVVERQQTEALLRKTAAEIEDLYNNAPCGYHSVDRDGVIIRINDTELGWLGYRRDEVVGKMQFAALLSAPSQEVLAHYFPILKAQGRLEDIGIELVRRDGSLLYASLNATAVVDQDGNYLHSRSTLFDMSQRRATEQNLRQANAFLDTILEHIPDMIFVKEAEHLRFVRFNRAGTELIGHTRDELIGKNDYDFFPAAEADFFVAKDREVLTAGKLLDIPEELMHTAKRGVRLLHTKKIPILDDSGQSRYLLGISEDVTERRQAERQILELNRELQTRAQQLEAANKELESFSYSVSHDLRAPLRAIDGFSRMLHEEYGERLDAEGKRLLGVVRDNGKRMARLVEDLLAFSRLGRQSINAVAVDMNVLAREAYAEIPAVDGVRARQFVMGKLPGASGDPVLLRQVWANLLSNAVKYSSVRETPRVAVEGWVDGLDSIYRIDDNGVGFDMQYYNQLFGVFHRLHTAAEFPGTGVGLAIVQRLVTRHGGRVWAEGRVDDGATFYFSLPTGGLDG